MNPSRTRREQIKETGKVLQPKKEGQETKPNACIGCGKPGKPRVDNGLPSGIHCDECWNELVTECRKRSW